MEVVVIVVVVIAVVGLVMVKPANLGALGRRGYPKEDVAAPQETVASIIQRRTAEKKERHRSAEDEWESAFFSELPPKEHPDYVEPTPYDVEGDVILEKTTGGRDSAEITEYWTPDNKMYSIKKRDNPVRYQIIRGDYSEDITGKWLRLKKQRKNLARESFLFSDEDSLEDPVSVFRRETLPDEELARFYRGSDTAEAPYLDDSRFIQLRESTTPGNCSACGKFKKKISLGYYICKDEYYSRGEWRHRF